MLKPVLSSQTSLLIAKNTTKARQRNTKPQMALTIDTSLGDKHDRAPQRLFSPSSCTHAGQQKANSQVKIIEGFSATNEIDFQKLHKNDEEECQYMSPKLSKKQLKRRAKYDQNCEYTAKHKGLND